MTIKEVEQTVGITKANIRFYEKEGLLEPNRNTENNYRNYTEADILLLKKIKLLRGLGISLFEIRTLIEKPDTLADILENRLLDIELEKQQLKETEDACRQILKEHIDFDSLSETLIDEQTMKLKDRIALALTEDLTEKKMSGKRLTDMIGGMLLLSFAATALITNFIYYWGTGILPASDGTGTVMFFDTPFLIWMALSMATALMIGMTAKPLIHLIMFLLLTLSQSFAVAYLNPLPYNSNLFIALACGYVIVIWVLTHFVSGYLKHWLYAFIPAVIFVAAALVIFAPSTDSLLYPAIFFIVFAFYISLRWFSLVKGVEICNRYYAITSALQMINVVAFVFSARGSAISWRRGDKEYD